MNLLLVQDALKNASDQQLAQMMQSPDSSAPSYLVLSEIRRRKDMRRQQQQQPPSGTVAEELTAPEDQGIRALQPMSEQAPQETDDQAGIEAMREGGVVRMQTGGSTILRGLPITTIQAMLDGGVPIPQGISRLDVMNALSEARSANETTGPGGIGVASPPAPSAISNMDRAAESIRGAGSVLGRAPEIAGAMPSISERPNVMPRNIGRAPLMSLYSPGSAFPSLGDIEAQATEAERNERVNRVMGEQEQAARAAERSSELATRARELAIRDIRGRISGGTSPDVAIREALPGYRGVTEQEMRQVFSLPPQVSQVAQAEQPAQMDEQTRPDTTGATPPPATPATPPPAATTTRPTGTAPATEDAERPAPTGQQPQATAPTPSARGGAGTPGGAPGVGAPSVASGGSGVPSLRDLYGRNEGLFSDGIAALRNRANEERVDPVARRNEAVNMALVEAGLRIAGSRNPSLIGAIGEGGLPAVQSYQQQLGQIRQEQRESRRDELEMAKQELNRQFAIGQISAAEYRSLIAEAGANRRLAAQLASQGANQGRAIAAETARTERAFLSTVPGMVSEIGREIRPLRARLAELGPEPPENAAPGSREARQRQAWVAQGGQEIKDAIRSLEEQRSRYTNAYSNAFPSLRGQQQTSTPTASGARIVDGPNGRAYVPAGS
jgi:hypothetical protein